MSHTKDFYTKEDLTGMQPRHGFFVGIDSDGCVFDTMEIKQKQCFHSLTIRHWGLGAVEKAAREVLEFVNLYSVWRGQNRFISQVQAFKLLADHPAVRATGVKVPPLQALQRFIDSGAPLGNPAIAKAVAETGDPELALVLKWSQDVNDLIATTVKNVPPYPWCRQSLERIAQHADAVCVSQTPTEALVREWDEHFLRDRVRVIAGQELGTKAEHIQLGTQGRYAPERILMIGDAPGDRKAAALNRALFYPINPLHEAASWERFYKEAFDRFLNGAYAGAYEAALIAEFEALLPAELPWLKK